MSDIILPISEEKQEEESPREIVCNYEATQDDEEKFILMYHMHMQPSEVDALDIERRRWLIGRFIGQKNMEREQMMQARMMQQIGPNLRVD